MTSKTKYIIAVLALVVAFAGGRYSVPQSTKTTKQDTVTDNKTDNKTEDDSLHKHTKTVIVDTTNPDGSHTKTTTKETDVNHDDKKTETSADTRTETKTETKEVTRSGSRLSVAALAGTKINSFSSSMVELDYGASVSRDLIGPISIGAFGFKSGLVGVSVGLSF